jgi:hypothetical protein
VTSLKDDQNKGRLKLFSPLRAAVAVRPQPGSQRGHLFHLLGLVAALQLHARINNDNKTPTIKEEL